MYTLPSSAAERQASPTDHPVAPPVIPADPDAADEATRFISAIRQPGDVFELRAFGGKVSDPAVGGFFRFPDDLASFRQKAKELSGSRAGVYVTLNPVNPGLYDRSPGRVQPLKKGGPTTNADVERRTGIFIDVDPIRQPDTSATDAERAAVVPIVDAVRQILIEAGWPAPIHTDSGNGNQLIYPADLPAEDGGRVKRLLNLLAERVDTVQAKVDTSVFNPGRLVKLPGTLAAKGKNTPDRPHRLARLLDAPPVTRGVTVPDLDRAIAMLAGPAAEARPAGPLAGGGEVDPAPGVQLADPGVVARARAYLAALPPAISGQGGHNRTFQAARTLWNDFAIDEDSAWPLLADWNKRCQPPWNEKDLRRKLAEAVKAGPDDRGWRVRQGAMAVKGATRPPWELTPVTMRELFNSRDEHRWLAKGLLVDGLPIVFAGPQKSLKSSFLVDLAVSRASGTPFLGRFAVPDPRPVVYLSGESGPATIREIAWRVAEARKLDPRDLPIHMRFELPALGMSRDVEALGRGLRQLGARLVIIDPLYLCLLRGGSPVDPRSLYEMGARLQDVAAVCTDAGATLVVAHHANRKMEAGKPMELGHLSYAGLAEFARQWFLVSRKQAYDGSGVHHLWLSSGGSAGTGGLWAARVEEGEMNSRFWGRYWTVTLQSAAELRAAETCEKEERKKSVNLLNAEREDERVKSAIQKICMMGEPATCNQLTKELGMAAAKVKQVLSRLVENVEVEDVKFKKQLGRGKRTLTGYRLVTNGQRRRAPAGDQYPPP